MKKIVKMSRVTELDIINAESSESFKSAAGHTVPMLGAAIVTDDKSGEEEYFSYLFGADGSVYGGNSDTVRGPIEQIIDYMELHPEVQLEATVTAKPSSSGREFLTIRFAEVK
jgi:hypothetical protein